MPIRSVLFFLALLAAWLSWPSDARADIVRLRSDMCAAAAPADLPVEAAAVTALPFNCAAPPAYAAYRHGWVWLKLRDPAALAQLPRDWRLLIDQTRFRGMAALVVAEDGAVQRIAVTPSTIGDNWAPGAMLRFRIERPGAEVRGLYLGFRQLDHLSLMRKVSAADPQDAIRLDGRWLGLMGVFAGALLSAFAYNLLIYTGQRLVFQRWYLVWSTLALAYGFTWTNTATFLLPGLVGPAAVSLDYLLVSALIAAGNMFFVSVIEEGVLPRWVTWVGAFSAVVNLSVGLAAWSGWFASPVAVDRMLNLVFILGALCLSAGVIVAIRRRSRVVWFYLAGWTPVLTIFALRVGRNFGLLVQDDTVDMGTFAALAFESVALSLAIADRFRLLRAERDAAEQARKVIKVESETFRRAAQTDFLTKLGNRAAFQVALRSMCEAPGAPPFMLLLVDVDHLKDINDRLGHDGGDMLLESVGKGLRDAARGRGHVSRIGGDEFAILLPGGEHEQQCIQRALEALQGTTLSHAGRSWALSLSIGSARFPEDATAPEVLVKNADLALYQAKHTGRRRLHQYDVPLRAGLDRRQAFAREAEAGVERGEFSLHYQPIVDLRTGQATSCEALLRWRHPDHGVLTPATFGDLLSEGKVGLAVQQHVFDQALSALRDHPGALPRLSFNLTAAQIDGPLAAARLLARIADHGLEPGRLCVEVTEDHVLDRRMDETAQALGLLHDAGVSVALDDFGTGYASLIHLKHLPFDILKIDRSFTLGLFEDDGQSEEIIRAIIGLGQGLRKKVVAEGVETQRQRQRLAEMGCDLGQGYLFARPAPLEALTHAQSRTVPRPFAA
ncbi:EAL domain-containing protein [Novosphingobium sp. FGD1]|uniref:EAL domain-containing protein n=1 Tax=Novosphingobium silvae TaxID=2692619 RepID=A0A7X4K9G7_9SPHN|nr:EAL domain-containing protein [Novosphingobium silvae]MYM00360.1 EAL domain-containing protein [Novosphingobium silvae]